MHAILNFLGSARMRTIGVQFGCNTFLSKLPVVEQGVNLWLRQSYNIFLSIILNNPFGIYVKYKYNPFLRKKEINVNCIEDNTMLWGAWVQIRT